MAQSSAVNTDTKLEQSQLTVKNVEENNIKKEVEVKVKPEPHECVVCATRAADTLDIYSTNTVASGTTLYEFMCKFTPVDLANTYNNPKYMCKSCFDLVNVLEQAELEYMKLKHTFEAIISKNPLYEPQARQTLELDTVKAEIFEDVYDGACENLDVDSEDEPLALTKKKRHRKVDKRKKKPTSTINKRKLRNKNGDGSWECNICGMHGATGGELAESAHKLNTHSLEAANPILREVKKENSVEGSQSPHYNNGFDTASDTMFKIEMGDFNDDRGSNFTPDDLSNGDCKKSGILLGRHSEAESASAQKKKRKKRETKVIHQCDQCDAKYTSLSRLEHHKQKHEHSKPPYICEVCGAHYKHKRACDIHVAMHKGISDWKCEECNKLFPSKGALQRHNNIHTGKPNYQCDLCGKSFIHTSSFKMHKLSHSGVKSHACDVCGLALMTRSHLKRHKRVHSGEKRHECAVCGKRFSERYNLVAHSKSHESAADAPQPPQPRRRLFRCNFCQERYERRYMLERHTSLVHGRTLERPPPTPRNTMSKLLKAQAQGRRDQPPPAAAPPAAPPAPPHAPQPRPEAAAKGERSPEPRPPPAAAHKLLAHISSASISASAWSGAYAAEFGLRHEFPH